MTKLDTAHFPKKPNRYLLNKGMYECSSCVPKFNEKADKPITGAVTRPVSKGPAGSHAVSGSWRKAKVNSISDDGLTVTLQMSDPNGQCYDAKLTARTIQFKATPATPWLR